jgi:hypothetical protein
MNLFSESEITNIIKFGRFATRNKSKGFALMEELDKRSKEAIRTEDGKQFLTEWRVGRVIRDRIVIEIDSLDIENARKVNAFYSNLYQIPFIARKTMHGYHLIQKQGCKDLFDYNACRLLYPTLKPQETEPYREKLYDFWQKLKNERGDKEFTKTQLQNMAKEVPNRLKADGLFCGCGNFDILHALNGIGREKYVLRISKKTPEDTMEEVTL